MESIAPPKSISYKAEPASADDDREKQTEAAVAGNGVTPVCTDDYIQLPSALGMGDVVRQVPSRRFYFR